RRCPDAGRWLRPCAERTVRRTRCARRRVVGVAIPIQQHVQCSVAEDVAEGSAGIDLQCRNVGAVRINPSAVPVLWLLLVGNPGTGKPDCRSRLTVLGPGLCLDIEAYQVAVGAFVVLDSRQGQLEIGRTFYEERLYL